MARAVKNQLPMPCHLRCGLCPVLRLLPAYPLFVAAALDALSQNIDASRDGGLFFACSGTITPWDSHMGR